MADILDSSSDFNPEDSLKFVRAALSPNESDYLKLTMGKDAPGLMDYLVPTGQFTRAREQRDLIRQAVMMEGLKIALQKHQAPTVAEAQALYPGFPIPPQAMKTTPQAPLQSNEMPVLQDTQQVQVPSKMQGPMPGVMTPLGEFTQHQRNDVGRAGLSMDQNMGLDERQPYFYEEAPRPMRTIDVGQYGPDMAPSQATVMDPTTKLPPSFQAQLGALQHQTAQRQTQPHYPSAEELKYGQALELGKAAWIETNPGKQPTAQDLFQIQQQAAGQFEKTPMPNSIAERKQKAEAGLAEKKLLGFDDREMKELDEIRSRTSRNIADTKDSDELRQAKLNELVARTRSLLMQGNVSAAKAEVAAFSEQLRLDERAWSILQSKMLSPLLDDESKRTVLKSLLERSGEFAVNPAEPGVIDRILQRDTGQGVKVRPAPGAEPYKWTNPSGKSGLTEIPSMPQTPKLATPQRTQADFSDAPAGKAKGDILKKGGRPIARWDGKQWVPLE